MLCRSNSSTSGRCWSCGGYVDHYCCHLLLEEAEIFWTQTSVPNQWRGKLTQNMRSNLHFLSNTLMNLQNFATVHSLMNDTKFDWQLPSSLARAISVEHRIHSPYVTLVLWLKASHTWVACAKQASCLLHWFSLFTLAVPLFHFALPTKPLIRLNITYKIALSL